MTEAGAGRGTERAERRRPLAVARLRPRLVATFALVAALASVTVATTSYLLVRRVTLDRATQDAVRQGRSALDDGADRLPPAPTRDQVNDLATRLRARGGFDVVAVDDDGSFVTSSISRSAASVPADLAAKVAADRVAWARTGSGQGSAVVVGGRLPDGPDLYLFFSLAERAADLDVLRNVLAAVSGGVVLLSALLGAVAARGLLRPLRRARSAANRLELGLYQTRLPEQGRDEFADLAHSFNRMADALEHSMADLRSLEASHRRFVSDVSHELRTPLTTLVTAAGVLEAHAAGLDDHGTRAARLLVVESRRLAALVEDLMEISRLDANVAHMEWEPVDLGAVAAGALDLRGWTDRVEVHDAGAASTWGDRRRLDAIVGNLVGNAMEHGSPPVRVEVSAGEEAVTLAVTDSGPGIPPEHAAHVFDRFYKADPARSRTSGSGLGLAIARENARLHGGDVDIADPPGRGTTFVVVLPVRSGAPEPGEAPSSPSVAEPLPKGDAVVTTARLTAITPRKRGRRR
ncbi:MAG: ATP-binding protein [Acidimicrobiales bacterium]